MRKRILSLVLVLAMLLGAGPAYAAGVQEEGYKGEVLAVTPPEEVERTVHAGTAEEELGLPETLPATVRETVVQITLTGE